MGQNQPDIYKNQQKLRQQVAATAGVDPKKVRGRPFLGGRRGAAPC